MRRAVWLAFLASVMLAAGCTPAAAPAATRPGAAATPAATQAAPTAAPGNAATSGPSQAATAGPAAAAATAAPTPAATAAGPAATAPGATATPGPQATAAAAGPVATFTSPRLGISFSYATSVGGQKVGVLEQADRVYVYVGSAAPTAGQWVQVYRKPAGQSLVEAIQAQVLKGFSLQSCVVAPAQNPDQPGLPWPAGYSFATIKPSLTGGDEMGGQPATARKCPQPYAPLGGMAYFVADAQHPEQFAFLNIGQYQIPAAPDRPWQTTLRFLDAAGGEGVTPEPTQPVAAPGSAYIDDRSSPQALITSYFNAINQYEYSRAYSYWNAAAGQASGLPPYPQFRDGYTGTRSVQLTLGTITGDAGAGQLYYWVPVALAAQNSDGTTQTFAGCYRLHLSQPANQGVPPFRPLAIESATVKETADRAAALDALASACAGGGHALPATPAAGAADIGAARYSDDRSDAVGVLRSLFNAINRKEYVRAYSYWEADSLQRAPFDQFQQGYADTVAVELATGTNRPGAAAGNIYYEAPAVLTATKSDGSRQTFAGCYTLHMANPGMQMEPPFVPLGIQSARVRQVANGSDPQALLQSACSQ